MSREQFKTLDSLTRQSQAVPNSITFHPEAETEFADAERPICCENNNSNAEGTPDAAIG